MFVLLTLIAVPVVAEEPDSTALPLWIQAQMAPKKVPAGVPADPSAARQGVASVGDEVLEDLPQVGRVHSHRTLGSRWTPQAEHE